MSVVLRQRERNYFFLARYNNDGESSSGLWDPLKALPRSGLKVLSKLLRSAWQVGAHSEQATDAQKLSHPLHCLISLWLQRPGLRAVTRTTIGFNKHVFMHKDICYIGKLNNEQMLSIVFYVPAFLKLVQHPQADKSKNEMKCTAGHRGVF